MPKLPSAAKSKQAMRRSSLLPVTARSSFQASAHQSSASNGRYRCGNNRHSDQSAINVGMLNSQLSARRGKARLHQVNTDTFSLLPDGNPSPNASVRNALICNHPSSHCCDYTTQGSVSVHTSNTPQNQGISRPEGQQPPQALVNNRTSFQDDLNPPNLIGITVTRQEFQHYLELLDTPIIKKFLRFDVCRRFADKYLLAMAFMYFCKSRLTMEEHNPLNFFALLFLAHDMEEDEEDKYEIFPWALGVTWREKLKHFFDLRNSLWKRMDYRAAVSRKCCEEIMAIEADHPLWLRERLQHHSAGTRSWHRSRQEDPLMIVGPYGSPPSCHVCGYPPEPSKSTPIEHDSLSPQNDKVWLEIDSSATSLDEYDAADMTMASTASVQGFNMDDMQRNLLVSSNSTGGRQSSGYIGDSTLDWIDCCSDSENNMRAWPNREE